MKQLSDHLYAKLGGTKYFRISERKIASRMYELGTFHRGDETLVGP